MDYQGEGLAVLAKALQKNGLLSAPTIKNFLKGKGLTGKDIWDAGGCIPLLMDMIPKQYPTVDQLIAAIKKEKEGK
jgi:hypothetical protein